jgi:hypothetical protein
MCLIKIIYFINFLLQVIYNYSISDDISYIGREKVGKMQKNDHFLTLKKRAETLSIKNSPGWTRTNNLPVNSRIF